MKEGFELGATFGYIALFGVKGLLYAAVASRPRVRVLGRCRRRIQLVNATDSLNISAGVLKPSVLRGLSFNCLAIALSCSCE